MGVPAGQAAGRRRRRPLARGLALTAVVQATYALGAGGQSTGESHPAVSPTGDRVAFESNRDGGTDLYWMSLSGGPPRRLTKDHGHNRQVTWSPSGDRVAFESDRDGTWQVYVRALDDSLATRATDLEGGAAQPDFSPDGQRLVVASTVGTEDQLFEVDLTTGTATQLTSTPGNKSEPAYSPVGDRIAYLTDATGGIEIAVAWSDGSGEKRITSFAEEESSRFVNGLGWTPEGRLVFAADREGRGRYFFATAIYTLAPDGSDLRRIVGGLHNHNNPSMARDGSLIAFDSFRFGGADVFGVRPNGQDLRRLTAISEDNFYPVPTADGERVIFGSQRAGNRDIYIMDRDGADVRNLTRNPEDDRAPSLTRDGRTVAFVSFRASEWGDIYTMDPDGGSVTKVTPDHFFEEINQFAVRTSITPDGQTILFESVPIVTQGEAHWDIWRIDRDGSHARRLTNTTGTRRTAGPEISPDGKSFLYFTNESGDYEIYRMPIEGGDPVQLTDNPGVDEVPTWSPSGDTIYFTSRRDGRQELYRMNADGSDVQRITYSRPGVDYYGGRMDLAGRNLWAISGSLAGNQVHRLEPDGSNDVSLTAPWGPTAEDPAMSTACTGFTRLGQPHWSWTRNEIVFPGDCGGGGRSIFVYSVDDDALRRLDVGVDAPDSPAWSYSGDRVAFNGLDDNDDRDLYVYDVDSRRTQRVTRGGAWGGWVTWSPDDVWLNGYGPNTLGRWDIFRVRADGSERGRLNPLQDGIYNTVAESPLGGEYLFSKDNSVWRMTLESSPEKMVGGRIAAVMPRWAPDGRRYVFDGYEGFGGWNLYVADVRLGEPIRLTERDELDSNATWSPDGERIVYDCAIGEVTTLCIVDVETRRSVPLFLSGL